MQQIGEPRDRFDSDLQMYCDGTREPDLDKLRVLCWLAERGQFDDPVLGRPAGVYAECQQPGAKTVSNPATPTGEKHALG